MSAKDYWTCMKYHKQLKCGTLQNVHIPSSKPYINSCACRLTEPTLRAEITTSEKFQFHI